MCLMWHPISTAPFDRDLELAVIDVDGVLPSLSSRPWRMGKGWKQQVDEIASDTLARWDEKNSDQSAGWT